MKAVKIFCTVVTLILVSGGSFLLGRMTAPAPEPSITFYASIDEITGNILTVSGLEINDINTRGRFSFTVDEDTALEWRNTGLSLDDLDPGDTIAVTYTGYVLETSPAKLEKVVKIQLLDDEK